MQITDHDSTITREKLLRHCNEFSRDYAGFLVVRAQLSFPVFKYPFFTKLNCICVCVCCVLCVCVVCERDVGAMAALRWCVFACFNGMVG